MAGNQWLHVKKRLSFSFIFPWAGNQSRKHIAIIDMSYGMEHNICRQRWHSSNESPFFKDYIDSCPPSSGNICKMDGRYSKLSIHYRSDVPRAPPVAAQGPYVSAPLAQSNPTTSLCVSPALTISFYICDLLSLLNFYSNFVWYIF